jgi:hypothetical protein
MKECWTATVIFYSPLCPPLIDCGKGKTRYIPTAFWALVFGIAAWVWVGSITLYRVWFIGSDHVVSTSEGLEALIINKHRHTYCISDTLKTQNSITLTFQMPLHTS